MNILTTCNRGGLCSFIVAINENSNGNYELVTQGSNEKAIIREIYYSIDNGEQLYVSLVSYDEKGIARCNKLENASVDLTDGLKLKSDSLIISLNGQEIEIKDNPGGESGGVSQDYVDEAVTTETNRAEEKEGLLQSQIDAILNRLQQLEENELLAVEKENA